MKNFPRKMVAGLFLLVAVLLCFMPARPTRAASADQEEARAQFENACRQTAALQSVAYDGQLELTFPIGKVDIVSASEVIQSPWLKAKSDSRVMVTFLLGKPKQQEIPAYLMETENEYLTYSKMGNQWTKISISKDSSAAQRFSPYQLAEKSMGFVKQVSLLEDDGKSQKFSVACDGKLVAELAKRLVKFSPKEKNLQDDFYIILDNLGDIRYTIVADKENGYILESSCDLTLPCRLGAQALLEKSSNLTPEQQEILRTFIQSSSVVLHLQCSRFNAIEDIAIPEEVLAAKEKSSTTPGNTQPAQPPSVQP